MRVVEATAVRPRRSRPGIHERRIAHLERTAMAVVSALVLAGVALAYQGQAEEFDAAVEAIASGEIVNLASMQDAARLAAALNQVDSSTDRAAIAGEVFRQVRADPSRLTHVGALASMTMPATPASRNASAALLDGQPGPRLFTMSGIAAVKPRLVVRTPPEYRRQILVALALFMAGFWAAHVVRWRFGTTGDGLLLPAAQLLSGIGLIAMIALRDPLRDTIPAGVFAGGVAAGCILVVLLSFIDFEDPRLRRAVLPPLVAAVVIAAALLVFGSGPSGSGAKVNLLGMQPVEVIRLLAVFSLAAYFSRRWEFLRELSDERSRWLPRRQDVLPLVITIATLLAFFFLQKDLGPALVLCGVFLGLYGIARARVALVLGGFAGLLAGFLAGYAIGIPDTVTRRVAIWLDPWRNGVTGGDQIAHALWAFSTGGLWGVGPGIGDPQFIPAAHTDLVLAAVGEELGFLGTFVVVLLFSILVWRLLRIAVRAPGDYTAFLTAGLCLALVVQAIVIAAGVLGLLPLSGVVTPFLSYGRSAMLCNFAALGICCAIARRARVERAPFVVPVRTLQRTLATIAAVVVMWAGYVQVIRADTYATRGTLARQGDGGYRFQYNPRLTAAARRIVRGTIYDRDGLPLATSRPEELTPFVERFRQLGLDVTDCGKETGRCYPLGGLAYHVLGDAARQTNWAARNASFVERDFDATLKGFDDRPRTVEVRPPGASAPVLAVTRDYSGLLPLVRHKGYPGHRAVRRVLDAERSVHSSIDARLQLMTARALRDQAEASSGKGAAIVIDPDTGQLLALASYPWPEDVYGPSGHTPSDEDAPNPLLDRARYGLYPPGSTFKVVTAAAAFRSRTLAQQSTFQCVRLPGGRVGAHVRGAVEPVHDDHLDTVPHGSVDLRRAIVVSCNAYFANLANRVGAGVLAETAAAAQLAPATAPVDRNLARTLPHAGYGQGEVVASPLRMARVAAAVASGGMLRDVVVTMPAGTPARRGRPSGPPAAVPGTQWISADAARQLARYMREAVTGGTGRALAQHPDSIAGKTGTAEVDGAGSHSWFIGFAPFRASERKVAFAVLIENAGYGGRAAAPVAGRIVSAARAARVIE